MQNKAPGNDLCKDAETLELDALKERLAMSFEERIEAHENARRLLEDLLLVGENERAKFHSVSSPTDKKP